LNGEKSDETAATTATLPPPIKSSRRVRLEKAELAMVGSVADTDGTTEDVTSDSGDGFILGEPTFAICGKQIGDTVKVFTDL
jgi:hypothetical protein